MRCSEGVQAALNGGVRVLENDVAVGRLVVDAAVANRFCEMLFIKPKCCYIYQLGIS